MIIVSALVHQLADDSGLSSAEIHTVRAVVDDVLAPWQKSVKRQRKATEAARQEEQRRRRVESLRRHGKGLARIKALMIDDEDEKAEFLEEVDEALREVRSDWTMREIGELVDELEDEFFGEDE